MNKKSFTILEILVVLAVVALLIGIAVPRLRGMQDQSNIARVKVELSSLKSAVESYYANISPHVYPPTTTTLGASYLVTANPQIITIPFYDPWGATSTTEYNYKLSTNGQYYVISSVGPNGAIGSCLTAGTKIILADGTTKAVEHLQVGDVLLGSNGAKNKVLDIGAMPKQDRKIYSFNGGNYFVTVDHLFSTKNGWAALDPELAQEMHPGLKVTKLAVGSELVTRTGVVRINKIDFKAFKDSVVYNPQLDGSHDYYADGFLVHNSPAPPAGISIDNSGNVTGKGADDICVTNGNGC